MGGHPDGMGKIIPTPCGGVDAGRKSGSRRGEVPVAMRRAGIVDDEMPGGGDRGYIAIGGGNRLVEFAPDFRSVNTVGGEVSGYLAAGDVARAANNAFQTGWQGGRRVIDISQRHDFAEEAASLGDGVAQEAECTGIEGAGRHNVRGVMLSCIVVRKWNVKLLRRTTASRSAIRRRLWPVHEGRAGGRSARAKTGPSRPRRDSWGPGRTRRKQNESKNRPTGSRVPVN